MIILKDIYLEEPNRNCMFSEMTTIEGEAPLTRFNQNDAALEAESLSFCYNLHSVLTNCLKNSKKIKQNDCQKESSVCSVPVVW